jgi:hypothetical protein
VNTGFSLQQNPALALVSERGETGGRIIGRRDRSTRRKSASVSL